MTQQEWDNLSEHQRQTFLQSHNAKVSTQMAINGNSRVSDNSPAFVIYSVYRGSVLTGRANTLIEAAQMDHDSCGLDVPKIQGLDEAYDQYKAIESGDLKIERTK